MIQSLSSFRIVFMVMIFLHHYPIYSNNNIVLFPEGFSAVTFFFVLSGFVLSYRYENEIVTNDFNQKEFLLKRFRSIYPMHIITLVIALFLSLFKIDCLGLLMNLFLLQSWIPSSDIYFSGNPVSWFLSDIVFYYCIFYLVVKFILKRNSSSIYLFIILTIMLFIGMKYIPKNLHHSLFYINPLTRSLDFVLGVLLYFGYKKMKMKQLNKLLVNSIELFSVALLVLFVFLGPNYIPKILRYNVYYWLPFSILILGFALTKDRGFISKLINNKWILWMSKYSFSFYLLHVLIIKIGKYFALKTEITPFYYMLIPIFIVTIISGYLIESFIKKINKNG